MRILLLSPYPPYPPRSGGALRIYNLLRGLAARHELWCLTFAANEEAVAALDPLRQFCELVTVRGPLRRSLARRAATTLTSLQPDLALRNASLAYGDALRQLLAAHSFDLVQAESLEMAGYGINLGIPAVLDQFNAEYLLQRSAALTDLRSLKPRAASLKPLLSAAYSLVQWRKLAAYERRVLRHYAGVLAVSASDRQALLRLNGDLPIAVVPNGVDGAYFAPGTVAAGAGAASGPYLVFTGTLDFRPNVDALHWFVQQILPALRIRRPELRFLAVGKSPGAAVRALHGVGGVEIHADVPDVRPFIAGAAAYVVPMRMGGGVRLKLLEALAMAAPVVSTSMGAEGVEGLVDGSHLLLADHPAAFVTAVLRLIDQPSLAQELGAAGRALALDRYDWSVIAPRLEQAYRDFGLANPEQAG